MGIIVAMIMVLAILFVGMIFFMQKFFNREVSSATSHLDTLISETAAKEEEVKKQLEDAKRQSQEIISNAQKDAQQQKEAVLKAAQEEKNKLLNEVQAKTEEMVKQADNARLALIAEAEQKIKDGSVVKAVELLQAALPEDFRKEIHQRWADGVISNSLESLDRLRIPSGFPEVKTTAAFALTETQLGNLKKKLKEKLGFEVKLAEATDSSLIAGLVVTIGSLVLDGSLKFKIQEVARAK